MNRLDDGVDVVFDGNAVLVLVNKSDNVYVAHQVNSHNMWLLLGSSTESCLPLGHLKFVRSYIEEDEAAVTYKFSVE